MILMHIILATDSQCLSNNVIKIGWLFANRLDIKTETEGLKIQCHFWYRFSCKMRYSSLQ